jgi:biotin carboxyl carrier protein
MEIGLKGMIGKGMRKKEVIEAMKMEMPVVAPTTGTVKEIKVSAGQEVEAEAVIAVIE